MKRLLKISSIILLILIFASQSFAAVTLLNQAGSSPSNWSGLSTDTKPTTGNKGSTFYEEDTTTPYIYGSSGWVQDKRRGGSGGAVTWGTITSKPEITVGDTGYATLTAAVTAIGATPATLVVPAGVHSVTTDVIIPATLTVRILKGADIQIGAGIAVTGTVSHAFTDGAGTITTYATNPLILGAGSNLSTPCYGNYYLKTKVAGNYSRVFYALDATHSYTTTMGAGESGVTWSYSTNIITGAGSAFLTEFEPGDILYISSPALVIPIACSKADGTLYGYDNMPREFDTSATGTATRSARLKFLGSVEIGNYKVFSGLGVAKFLTTRTSEVNPAWWGMVGDGDPTSADVNVAAFNKAAISMIPDYAMAWAYGGNGTIKIGSGNFYVNASLKFPQCDIRGSGQGGYAAGGKTLITTVSASDEYTGVFEAYPNCASNSSASSNYSVDSFRIHDLTITGKNAYPNVNGLQTNGIHISGCSSLEIDHIQFNTLNYAVYLTHSANYNIHDNFLASTLNGFNLADIEGIFCNNQGHWGQNLIQNGTFNTNINHWSQSASGWAYSSGVAKHTAGSADVLYQTIAELNLYGAAPQPMGLALVKFTISGRSAGTLDLYVFGESLRGGIYSNATYYQWVSLSGSRNIPYNSWDDGSGNPIKVIEFRADSSFNGSIDNVSIFYGTAMKGLPTLTKNNDLWSDGPNGATGIFIYGVSSPACIVESNHVHPAACGMVMNSGQAFDNSFDGCEIGMGLGVSNANYGIERNLISNSIYVGLYAFGVLAAKGVIRNNKFFGNALDTFNISSGTTFLMEDNYGIDSGVAQTLTVNSATPSVSLGKTWLSANTAITCVANFLGHYIGKQINVTIGDVKTILNFSTGLLIGNQGADHFCASGDYIRAVSDGTNWRCTTSWTPISVPAKCAPGTTAGKAKTQNAVTYQIAGLVYTKAATDDLFDCSALSTDGTHYMKVLFSLDAGGTATVTAGAAATTQATALLPAVPAGGAPIGYVELPVSYAGGALTGYVFHDFL